MARANGEGEGKRSGNTHKAQRIEAELETGIPTSSTKSSMMEKFRGVVNVGDSSDFKQSQDSWGVKTTL